jgi:hypothetical protein
MAEALIILGLPRSGAGTVAALAQRVGVHLGDQLLGARKGFPRGLFEDRRLVEINRDLLGAFDQTAVAGFPLPVRWEATPAGQLARFRAADLLAELAVGGAYALKDPRLVVTAPLWQAEAAAQGHGLRHVIALRDPLDLAQAMGQGDGAARARFAALWLAQAVQMLALSAGQPRLFVGFRDLLAEPAGVALRLRRFAGLGEGFRPGDAEAVRAFVPPEARRDAPLPEPQGFAETTARELARRMAAGDESWLAGFLAEGPGALVAALQAEGAAALAAAGRGPLAGSP